MSLLQETLDKIQKIDEAAKKQSRERIDILLKPVGSLGVLENIAEQLSAITGEVIPDIKKRQCSALQATTVCATKAFPPRRRYSQS